MPTFLVEPRAENFIQNMEREIQADKAAKSLLNLDHYFRSSWHAFNKQWDGMGGSR